MVLWAVDDEIEDSLRGWQWEHLEQWLVDLARLVALAGGDSILSRLSLIFISG